MFRISKEYEKDGFILRLSKKEDAERYAKNLTPLDENIRYYTGSRGDFTEEEVKDFFLRCIDDDSRYDFLLVDTENNVIGESVLNEIDWQLRKANFRICIFDNSNCGKGIGQWMIEKTLEFGFEEINLHRIELDVFSFNERAIKAYIKAGFKEEGRLKDAIMDRDKYADDILMAILEDEWRTERKRMFFSQR